MKKFINCILALAAVLFASSCQQESLESTNGLSTVSFTVEVPGNAATKGTGVVSNINNIVYAIYKTDAESLEDARISLAGKTPVNCVNPMAKDPSNTTAFVNNSANISIELFNDQKYIILFWAQVNETWVEGEEFDLTNITYPEGLVANSEDYAAFCGAAYVEKVKGSRSASVELTRPFAQINIAAANPGFPVEITSSRVKVSGAGKCFNVATGEASDNIDVIFATEDIPTEEFSAAYPHYIAKNYVFANGNVSVEYEINANLGQISTFNEPITNVPVQRNYKTNIVGNLLSSEIDYSVSLSDGWATPDTEWVLASSNDELVEAVKVGGDIKLTDDIQIQNTLDVKAGVDVLLDLNGKKIRIDADEFTPNSNGSQYAFIIRDGGSLEICGDGTVETSTPAPIMFYPAGNLVIKSGTFIRHIPEGYNGEANSMFVGTKPVGGWESTGVTIHGGYFDSGYYNKNAADIEAYLNGSKTLEETEDDIAKRGQSGDKNKIRVALKNNTMAMFNRSNNYFHIYGGTFVGANPAWGDEGCMLPTTPQYLRPWSYYQGELLDGQTFHEDGIVLPAGYTITHSTHEDGRPIYTVNYTKPEFDPATAGVANNEIWYTEKYNDVFTPVPEKPFGDANITSNEYDAAKGVCIMTFDMDVTTIGKDAFYDLTNGKWITSIMLPETVTSIGESAFYHCGSLTHITLGSNVETIASQAFSYCEDLKKIICKATTPPTIADEWIFEKFPSDAEVVVPAESVEAYKAAQYWQKFKIISE